MPSTAREARIAALEAELSALRGDRPAVHYDHNEPLEDPYAHTGVDPWGGWRTGRESYRRDLERLTYRDLLVAVLARLEGLEQRTTSRRRNHAGGRVRAPPGGIRPDDGPAGGAGADETWSRL